MTIRKKLYTNFGIILTMVLVLFLVNLVRRAARTCSQGCCCCVARTGGCHQRRALSDDAEPPVPEQLPAERRYPRSRPHERGPAHPERKAGTGQDAGQLRPGQDRSRQSPATGAGLGQGVRSASDRKAQRRGLRQRHRGRTADLLPPERRFVLGEEFDRRA